MNPKLIEIIIAFCIGSILLNIDLFIEIIKRERQIKNLIKEQTGALLEIEEKEKIMQEALKILEMSVEDPDYAAMDKLREGLNLDAG